MQFQTPQYHKPKNEFIITKAEKQPYYLLGYANPNQLFAKLRLYYGHAKTSPLRKSKHDNIYLELQEQIYA
jgi:hypothetical protein